MKEKLKKIIKLMASGNKDDTQIADSLLEDCPHLRPTIAALSFLAGQSCGEEDDVIISEVLGGDAEEFWQSCNNISTLSMKEVPIIIKSIMDAQ